MPGELWEKEPYIGLQPRVGISPRAVRDGTSGKKLDGLKFLGSRGCGARRAAPYLLWEPLYILSEVLHRGKLEGVRVPVGVRSITACKAINHEQGGEWSHYLVQGSSRDDTQQRREFLRGCRGQFAQEAESRQRAVHLTVQPHIAQSVDRRGAHTENPKPDECVVDERPVRGSPHQSLPYWGPDAGGQGRTIVERS